MNNMPNGSLERIKILLMIGILAVLTGCAGSWVEGYYNEAVIAPEPDMFLFSGDYLRGRDVRNYSRRGAESRRAAHPGGWYTAGSRGGVHPSGGSRGHR